MKATYKKYTLDFKVPSGTSRGILTQKETWFLILRDKGRFGIGECGLLKGLSVDDVTEYENKLAWVCQNIHLGKEELLNELIAFPSIQFGIEQAFLSLASQDSFELFPTAFTRMEAPIAINGLIWMGSETFMLSQLLKKLEDGFRCIKMKIGAIDFEKELSILRFIRDNFRPEEIELRVDANGAFSPEKVLNKLERLAEFQLHSIEQPIKPKQWGLMAKLCEKSPLPIALDEELIGIFSVTEKEKLLQTIKPQFIILKPSLVGGFTGSEQWITMAKKYNIGWWVTSALESNIGLNAIAQWTYTLNTTMPQGLGTGSLYTNNMESPLEVSQGNIYYRNQKNWNQTEIEKICL
ncbi:o-succinylbenzoate synthase [Flagellimonas sediminis]|uniref:O-succinylbenzoate synthase n=1 Tax=Flagellimonas sediminis TaxID=2696468 RepID=A0A6I5L142_9FLAO|nr:o-succinylbenzoate synthase [Allomuricauda sediminis]NDV42750.1 o-succinylbenzoate synthase [Allomuricauda sediminis]